MEELRSTDALDAEILNDSKKKAERILVKAEETSKAILDGVENRIQEAESSATNDLQQRIAIYKKNVDAVLPLEKERYLVSYVHNAVISAMNDYFEQLSKDKRLDIIKNLVERAKPFLKDKNVNAEVIGIDENVAKKMLSAVLGKSVLSCKSVSDVFFYKEEIEAFKWHEGVILKTEDEQIVCRLTLDEKVKEILDSQTLELAKSLFGGRLPE